MLLRFVVENFMSIRDETELSLVASALKDRKDSTLPSRYAKHGVLPVLSLYGPNASGKSTLLRALWTLRNHVVGSFRREQEPDQFPHKPFLLDSQSRERPTRYELDFIFDGIRFQFGLIHDEKKVLREWLYAFPKQLQQVLYSRESDEVDHFYFGRMLQGNNKAVQSITRSNSLFISAASQAGHPVLSKIYGYFQESINFVPGTPLGANRVLERLNQDTDLKKKTEDFLRWADTGVASMEINEEAVPDDPNLAEFFKAISKYVGDEDFKAPTSRLVATLGHLGEQGAILPLNFSDESHGTTHLFQLLPSVLDALRTGSTLVLDEITTSLHTLLSSRLIRLFTDPETNPHAAQLMFSTHDTNLLSDQLLRRDEIWFTEKSAEGVTTVFPLTDIRTKNSDNIERGYLQGRFGAVPLLREKEAY